MLTAKQEIAFILYNVKHNVLWFLWVVSLIIILYLLEDHRCAHSVPRLLMHTDIFKKCLNHSHVIQILFSPKPWGGEKNTFESVSLQKNKQTKNWLIIFIEAYADIPCFLKVCFYKRPTWVPVFLYWKKSKGIFAFMRKRWKEKVQDLFFSETLEAAGIQSGESGFVKFLPGNYTRHLSIQPPWLWAVSVGILCSLSLFILCIH